MGHMGSTGWYAAVGAVVIGGAFFVDRWTTPKASAPLETKPARSAKIAVPTPQPELEEVEEGEEAFEEDVAEEEELGIDYEVEAMRGHAPIDDPSEFAMVFTVDGTTYLRLSSGEQATSHGTRRLVSDGEVYAVVAPV